MSQILFRWKLKAPSRQPINEIARVADSLACSQTLYFLFKVRWARAIKYKPQGIYWPPAQGGSGGGRRNSRFRFARELGDVFEKNEKKNNVCAQARDSLNRLYIPMI